MARHSSPPFGSCRKRARTQNPVSLTRARWPLRGRSESPTLHGVTTRTCQTAVPCARFCFHHASADGSPTVWLATSPSSFGKDFKLARPTDSLIRVSRRATDDPSDSASWGRLLFPETDKATRGWPMLLRQWRGSDAMPLAREPPAPCLASMVQTGWTARRPRPNTRMHAGLTPWAGR